MADYSGRCSGCHSHFDDFVRYFAHYRGCSHSNIYFMMYGDPTGDPEKSFAQLVTLADATLERIEAFRELLMAHVVIEETLPQDALENLLNARKQLGWPNTGGRMKSKGMFTGC